MADESSELAQVLSNLGGLLADNGYQAEAAWLRERAEAVSGGTATDDINQELRSVVNGMGGLNDLYLPGDAGVRKQDLTERFWELTS